MPDGESVAELARRLGVDPATVQREVTRLERAGIVSSRRVGNTRVVAADVGSPIYGELRGLLAKAFGPAPWLEAELSRIDGVRKAYIFGSWARRFHGEPGPLPRDIDVLVVGSADPEEVYRAAQTVEAQLDLEVNPIVVAEDEWERHPLGLVARVQREPVVELEVQRADDR